MRIWYSCYYKKEGENFYKFWQETRKTKSWVKLNPPLYTYVLILSGKGSFVLHSILVNAKDYIDKQCRATKYILN